MRTIAGHEIAPSLDGEKGKAGLGDSILAAHRRLEIFITDLRFRRSLALPPLGPRISLPELLRGGKLVLLPVNSSSIGEKPAALISMMFMQMVKTAFLSRTGTAASASRLPSSSTSLRRWQAAIWVRWPRSWT